MEHSNTGLNPCQKVKDSCKAVMELAKHVKINKENLLKLVENIEETEFKYDCWEQWHFQTIPDVSQITDEQVIAYVFIIDALNFCFWPTEGFEYDQLANNLAKILVDDPEFFTSKRMAQATDEDICKIFTADFCLIQERSRLLREVGEIIETKFEGSFSNFVSSAGGNAVKLVDQIISNFPGFRDESIYNIAGEDALKGGQQVFFYKRVQILVGDLYAALENRNQSLVSQDIEQLTMFPDYRVPQILHHLGVFEYSEDLEKQIIDEEIIPHGDQKEVEIRAATIECVEQIKGTAFEHNPNINLKSIEVDWILWQMGEKKLDEMKPHHRTLSIFY
ncbi:unnamed protein product [Moneuplotes crassus]|uniref:Queuosine 5'-phosphate N-glycosylase/hydrolase n=2 Tax=Euplotes crassus TaxID=5936 RepID=A0AAD1XHD0_EUPCR|nr:unnamed protein product [Moneuplotes crassus]